MALDEDHSERPEGQLFETEEQQCVCKDWSEEEERKVKLKYFSP